MSEFEYTKRLLIVTERNVELLDRVHELEVLIADKKNEVNRLKRERDAARRQIEDEGLYGKREEGHGRMSDYE